MSSYPKIYNLGHKYLENLFDEAVQIEEKVDGSQFSFGRTLEGTLFYRSKGRELFAPVTDFLFKAAVEYVTSIANKLPMGYTYRGEVLCRQRHNTLAYDRTPSHNIIIFDIDKGEENYVQYDEKVRLAKELDLETVPLLHFGKVNDFQELKQFLSINSILGGATVEGMVIKNYNRFGIDKKTVMGKWVREEFKEANGVGFRKANPTTSDVLVDLIQMYKSPIRWEKAVNHYREDGKLLDDLKDIGPLIGVICKDVHDECQDEIKEQLFNYFWPKMMRGITGGFPDWYKERLAKSQFKETENVAI